MRVWAYPPAASTISSPELRRMLLMEGLAMAQLERVVNRVEVADVTDLSEHVPAPRVEHSLGCPGEHVERTGCDASDVLLLAVSLHAGS
eukprot:753985-Hanusia_phi.AAC.1